MEKMKMQSKNLTREQIEKMMELFPSCGVTETKLDIGGRAYRRGVYRTGVLQYAPTQHTQRINWDLQKQELSGHIIEGPTGTRRLD